MGCLNLFSSPAFHSVGEIALWLSVFGHFSPQADDFREPPTAFFLQAQQLIFATRGPWNASLSSSGQGEVSEP
jgi:hypothetical protein